MRTHGKNFIITIALCIVLFAVIGFEIVLFISGPSLRYDDKIASQKKSITEKYESIQTIERHVFSYVIYSGQDDTSVYWFNENGELMTKRDRDDIDETKAAQIVLETHGMENSNVTLGYGYKNPVYVISNEDAEVYLDIDTMKEVFYYKKG